MYNVCCCSACCGDADASVVVSGIATRTALAIGQENFVHVVCIL